jgi:VWFA-related protein
MLAAGVLVRAQQPPAQPVFKTGIDLVVVEATVVDKSGKVAAGLTPADFHVEVGGKPREVVSAVLVKSDEAPAARIFDDVSTNAADEGARTILLIVDQTSLRAQSRGVLDGTKRWIATLGKSDRVGLASIPPPGPRVEFTTEHERIVEGVGKVAPAPDAKSPLLSIRNVSLYEGLGIASGDVFLRTEVVTRECRGDTRICPADIDMAAKDIAMDAQFRVQRVLPALSTLVRNLGVLPGTKHLILISSGWPIDPRSAATEIAPIAAEAALSNTTIHTFTAEQWALSAAVSRPSNTQMQDRDILLSSVEMLSGMTGGQAARLYDNGDAAFKQLSAGLSGYYRLGVRVDPDDLDGKMRRIEVNVNRSGLTLSTYRKVMAAARPKAPTVAPAGTTAAASSPEAALRAAIEAAALATELDMRTTSYVLHDEGNSRDSIRVLAVGDVSGAAAGAATSLAVLYDLEGRPVANGGQHLEVPATQTARLQAAFTVKPGNYRLRFGVRDAEGHIGTVERGIDARWVKAGGAETTGLVLLRVANQAEATAEPVFITVSTTDRVVAQLALGAADKPEVVIDVLKQGGAAPLLSRAARIAKTAAGVMLVQESIPMALLPPGRYAIGATVLSGPTARLSRSFDVEPAAVPAAPDAPVKPGDLLAFVTLPRFSAATVLDPAVVGPILGRLAERPDVAAVKDELTSRTAGPWPTDVSAGPLAASKVAATFVAGLGRLSEGSLDAAANDFRSTLRAAPDFAPAMLYLGACFASGAKDREAAGAWQTALARERDLPILTSLAIDAWLRAERPPAALALARQARTKWPGDQRFVRQHALAALADGKRAEGLDIVVGMPTPDATLLLASLGALYEARRDGVPVWDAARDAAAQQQLRERYKAAGGEAIALVDLWAAAN